MRHRPARGWPSTDAMLATTSPRSGPPRACAATCGCPATSRSAIAPCILATLAAGESRITRLGRRGGRPLHGRASCARSGRRSNGSVTMAEPSTTGSPPRVPTASVEPDAILDCGNSGTSLRLIAGLLAGLPMTAILDGDGSLRRRPVARIIDPLRSMGAVLHGRRDDSLPPLTVVGHTPLTGVDITTAVPSAQVKSAILLAGLRAEGRTTVRERVATRDHTERMLRARGSPWSERTARTAVSPGRSKEGWRCRRSTSGSRATSRRRPSGWSRRPSIPTPS